MTNDNYITITGYMINELKLSGNELVIYAFIAGFEKGYTGSLNYIASSCGVCKKTALTTIEKLVSKGLVKKEGEARKSCKYTGVKLTPDWCKTYTKTGVKVTPNNTKYKTNYKKGSFTDFNQRIYNFSELEKLIRSN